MYYYLLTDWYGLGQHGWVTGASCICCRDFKIEWSTASNLFIETQYSHIQHEVVLGEARVGFSGVHVDHYHVVCGEDVWWCVGGRVPANGECARGV